MDHYKLVIGKFMPPHKGHDYLIRFASNYNIDNDISFDASRNEKTLVIVCGMNSEPMSPHARFRAMKKYYYDQDNVVVAPLIKDMPQEPGDDPDFWNKWKEQIEETAMIFGMKGTPHVFASEPYGMKLAEVLNGHFVPVDIERAIVPVSGTELRTSLLHLENWNRIIPTMRSLLQINVHIIGAESTGKTIMSEDIVETIDFILNGFKRDAPIRSAITVVPEYARGYLREYGNNNLSEQTWIDLFKAGISQLNTPIDAGIVVRDTSLLTTLGWAKILNPDFLANTTNDRINLLKTVDYEIRQRKHDLYFLLPDDVKFKKDPQRYGIYKRQSSKEFWKKMLDDYDIEYIEVPETKDIVTNVIKDACFKKTDFMIEHIIKRFDNNTEYAIIQK